MSVQSGRRSGSRPRRRSGSVQSAGLSGRPPRVTSLLAPPPSSFSLCFAVAFATVFPSIWTLTLIGRLRDRVAPAKRELAGGGRLEAGHVDRGLVLHASQVVDQAAGSSSARPRRCRPSRPRAPCGSARPASASSSCPGTCPAAPSPPSPVACGAPRRRERDPAPPGPKPSRRNCRASRCSALRLGLLLEHVGDLLLHLRTARAPARASRGRRGSAGRAGRCSG